MYPSKMDVPVLITFFARPWTLEKVFESVKQARPSTLLLWQDGPRKKHPEDIANINKCREIVSQIDWECKVLQNYHEENMGCDPSTFRAQKWAFDNVERCIVLEDDMVPNQCFYQYCYELLEKYKDDERINHICGVNPVGEHKECPNDYFFSYYGTGAWASWRRVAKQWDSTYSFLDQPYYLENLKKKLPHIVDIDKAKKRKATGFEWWEVILGYNCFLNNRLVIIPTRNLVQNVGVVGGTHSSSIRLMNKNVRKLFDAKCYDMDFPLVCPEYVVPDYGYLNLMSKINCKGRPVLKFMRKIEYAFRCLIYGELINVVKRKIKRNRK